MLMNQDYWDEHNKDLAFTNPFTSIFIIKNGLFEHSDFCYQTHGIKVDLDAIK
jgi:hypothetical protein